MSSENLNICLSRPQAGGRTNVHYLVFHLTLADSIICYVVLPLETLWRLTIEWHAGNLACKILMMFRTGGFILSSAILVVISIDRSVFIKTFQSSLQIQNFKKVGLIDINILAFHSCDKFLTILI